MRDPKKYEIQPLLARKLKIWPVPQYGPKMKSLHRMKGFGEPRPANARNPTRRHFGVDLAYVKYKLGVKVVAIEDGTVLARTRANTRGGRAFFMGTHALFIEHPGSGYVVNYGEISEPKLSKGTEVVAGEIIGEIGKRSNVDESKPRGPKNSMMLHLELLKDASERICMQRMRGKIKWPFSRARDDPPDNLENPRPYLETCTHYSLDECKKIVALAKKAKSK